MKGLRPFILPCCGEGVNVIPIPFKLPHWEKG